ncbi:MAG: rhodanese-like domain-containing protein [Chlorobiaceae bacterium]|nr:rhodanese-like domain-containing protein [Chlorobiaceae bacterium]
MQKINEVTPSIAFEMIEKGAVLVDVRESREATMKSFDISDMMQIPLSDFGKRYPEIPMNSKVILACRSGHRSMMAAGFLAENGYGHVFNLQDGIMNWERAGLPTKKAAQEGFLSRFMPGFLSEA